MESVEKELRELKGRIERLEEEVLRLTHSDQYASTQTEQASDRQHFQMWLKAQGLVRDPTPEEERDAAEWDELSDEEREAIRWELDHIPEGPMASDIVIANRG